MKKTKKKQTEMPWATAEKIARKIIIGALASEVRMQAGWYKQTLAFREEFKDRRLDWEAGSYDGKSDDDGGRCPVCYKIGEQVHNWGVCREHKVRWHWLGNDSNPQPLDPEQKKFLGSLSEVKPLDEPPQLGCRLFDRLRLAIEVGFIDAVMDHEWADHIMSKAEIKKFLAIRKKEGRKINPETAEVILVCVGVTDPYGLFPRRPYDNFDRDNFYRNPGSDIWVHEFDVPVATREAIRKKWDSRRCSRKS